MVLSDTSRCALGRWLRWREARGPFFMVSTLAVSERLARYLALGDSYTIGESVAPADRWPEVLVTQLRELGLDMARPQIIARTGWTTDELAAALDAAERGESVALTDSETATAPTPPYALVTLLIGVNDQYRGRPAEHYRQHLRALLQRSIAYAGGHAQRVLLLSIPDWGNTPFAQQLGRDAAQVASEIDQYNALAAQESQPLGVVFIDITALTRQAVERPELLAADGLHPSALDYARWAKAALASARTAVGASTGCESN